MGNIDYVRAMEPNTRPRPVECPIYVVKVSEAIDGPSRPSQQSTGVWVVMPFLERTDNNYGISLPNEWRHFELD